MGSLIMPHNIMLHSALVQSRGLTGASQQAKTEVRGALRAAMGSRGGHCP